MKIEITVRVKGPDTDSRTTISVEGGSPYGQQPMLGAIDKAAAAVKSIVKEARA